MRRVGLLRKNGSAADEERVGVAEEGEVEHDEDGEGRPGGEEAMCRRCLCLW
jgi:hypothetical protein